VTLAAGVHLGPYEIVGLIGAGGMGEVYRARDTRLHREVAVKVMRSAVALGPERLERFEREARAAAAISHPNILAVFDVGTDADGPYIVSELLDGETLRDALVRGKPWPVRRSVDVVVQIGRGLAAAHARGIVHRDLKPENVFLTDDGVVKILDFGLARFTEPLATAGTATAALTAEGVVVGTVGYMAPEALRGRTIDQRSDIFAFGAILYELLTGHRAFEGDSGADVVAVILSADPPGLEDLASSTVPTLARIVSRCLDKRPEARFQTASDLVFALEEFAGWSSAIEPPAVGFPRSRLLSGRPAAVMAGLLAAGVAGLLGFVWGRQAASTDRPAHAPSVQRLTDLVGLEEYPAISPDGRSVAFTASVDGLRQIFVRLIAGGSPLELTSAKADHQQPRWSPDSSKIVYFSPASPGEAQGAVWEVSALGGAPRRITSSLGGADIDRVDGRLACFRLDGSRIALVTSQGDGSQLGVLRHFEGGSYYWYPRWSPDARWIAFQRGDGVRFDVFAASAGGGEVRQLTHDNTVLEGFSWLPDSTGIVYSSSRDSTIPYLPILNLWEARFDAAEPRQVTAGEISYTQPDVHADGTLAVSRMRRQFDVWQFPVDGSPAENTRRGHRLTRQTGQVLTPTASPDGTEVAFLADSGGHANLWVIGIDGSGLRQITRETDRRVAVGVPVWSPDGRSIAFVSSRGSQGFTFGIWLVDPDGSNLRRLTLLGLGAAWSPDGRWIYYVERANQSLKKIPVQGGTAVVVRPEPTRNIIGSDGSTLYYLVERALVDGSPEYEIRAAMPEDGPSRVVAHVPASRLARWQIQIVNPVMSPDGRWLAQPFVDGFTTNVWAVGTASGQWRQITDFGDRLTFIARRVSWSADGRSILAAVGEGDSDIVLHTGLLEDAGR
jgi:Tol biopolymer transport system component